MSQKPTCRMHFPKPICEFDIDAHLDRFIPPPPFQYLPRPISHFLGYRPKDHTQHVCAPTHWFLSFAGAFIGVALIEAVFMSDAFKAHNSPLIIGSFGAAAILEYNAIASPLSQPRNFFLSHVMSAAVGIGITKLFMLLPSERFSQLQWLAGALSVGTSSALMSVTNTVHPPAGATALLAATSPDVVRDGWWLMVLVITACALMGASALIVNNIGRRWPVYWWTGGEVGAFWVGGKVERDDDVEAKGVGEREKEIEELGTGHVKVSKEGVDIPAGLALSEWEYAALQGIVSRLREGRTAQDSESDAVSEKYGHGSASSDSGASARV